MQLATLCADGATRTWLYQEHFRFVIFTFGYFCLEGTVEIGGGGGGGREEGQMFLCGCL